MIGRVHYKAGLPLPPGVSYTWQRVSRRQIELIIRDGRTVIFHARTDGRPWSREDVCELLRHPPKVDANSRPT